jgi:hypothetical protein
MKTSILCFYSCVYFFSAISFAQITPESYNRELNSLTEKKDQLSAVIKSLKFEIDSLNLLIPELNQRLSTEYRELYVMKYGNKYGPRVAQKQIWKGMKDEMVKDGWGSPDRIDKNVEPWGVFTQWYYGDIIFFFKNGKLIDWQEGPEQ